MRFLFLSDTHFRAERSRYRLDEDVVLTQLAEFEEVLQLAKDKDAVILHGGDFFDRPTPAFSLVVRLLELLNKYKVSFYSVVGNHDVTGFNHDSVINTGLGILMETGVVKKLDKVLFPGVAVHGIPAYVNPREGDYTFGPEYDGLFRIVVSHNFVIPQQVIFDAVHPREVTTNADLVLLGHYHKAFEHTEGNTQFLNVGSFSRWSISEKDQTPSVIFIDTVTSEITTIPLETPKLGSLIFDVEAIEDEKKRELDLENFVEGLETTSFDNVDLEQIVLQQGTIQGIPKEIIDLALGRIQVAKEQLK